MSKKYFFSPRDEKITLWIPIFGLLIAFFQLAFFADALDSANKDLVRFFVNVFLLNGTHLGFPFVMLIAFPKGRELVRMKVKRLGAAKLSILIGLLVLSVCAGAFFEVYPEKNHSFTREGVIFFMAWVWIIVPTFHGMRQSGGISLLMNRTLKAQLGENDRKALLKFEGRERKLFLGVYAGVVLGLIVSGSEYFSPPVEKALSIFCFSLSAVSAMVLLILIRRERIFRQTNKFAFSIRMLFWPLGLLSTLATWLLPLMHGQEYFALFNKAVREEEDQKVRLRAIRWLLYFVFALAFLSSLKLYLDYFVNGDKSMDTILTYPYTSYFLLLIPIFSLLHYITDSVIYRMSDTDVRETMGTMYPSFYENHREVRG